LSNADGRVAVSEQNSCCTFEAADSPPEIDRRISRIKMPSKRKKARYGRDTMVESLLATQRTVAPILPDVTAFMEVHQVCVRGELQPARDSVE
jgi:hypothetical protein